MEVAMQDYEKLGVFYLGRPYELASKQPKDGLLLYDSKDLVTHAICVGMTGSGKTGLCISLLEEAAMDNIPAIAIDPKGDLTNLLLTFPDLKASDFLPWINEDEAMKKGLSNEEYAAQQADLWRNGLTSWGQSGERIGRLRKSTDLDIYTPGSTAGKSISILKSFSAPPDEILEDQELLVERINTTVTSLLGLIGVNADPIKSREHILLSTILDNAWRGHKDIDIAGLIQQIQTPPVNRIGVIDLESFFSSKDRFELALLLNNLLAAPGFNSWLEGEPLDIGNLLHTAESKPKISIFYIAHLNDSERMFFVSLLLNQILGWMRTQSGTTSLRAIVYMDEIFGYFPPIANPPSKTPLLTLLKQARAFGVGVVLATQNPVDLDYKGLSNTGTWFIGRLQTERDKARVMEGLEGVAATTGMKFNRQEMEQTIAGLGNRIFIMNNVHEDTPVVFESRWAMSYLRGPLTRSQIKILMDPVKEAVAAHEPVIQAGVPLTGNKTAEKPVSSVAGNVQSARPVLPPDVAQYFIPLRGVQQSGTSLFYQATVIGAGEINFNDIKSGVNIVRDVVYQVPVTDAPVPIDWDTSAELEFKINDLETNATENAAYSTLPVIASKAESYSTWSKDFATWLYRMQKLEICKSPNLKEYSNIGESERDFRVRLQQKSREARDDATEKLRQKYATKMASLQEQLRRAEQVVDREAEQAKQEKIQTAISFGTTLLGSFMGRKALSTGTLGRATTSMRGVSRSIKQTQDVARAKETVAAHQQRLKQLEDDFNADVEALANRIDPMTEALEQVVIKPAKKDISINLLALCWAPYWQGADGKLTKAW
jgi:hypothetical protein